jgi:uroporphyrinogen decarboxylase
VTELKNDLLLRALLRQPVPRTPLWIMRQAGRYLPEYRATREQAGDFMSLCRNPELACEVTMQPLRRYKLDAAILFSDILTVPDALGLGLYFVTGEGPKFERPVRTASDIRKLPSIDVSESLDYVFDAVRTIRRELDGMVPLIGFSGSPWTVGTYMVEGRPCRARGDAHEGGVDNDRLPQCADRGRRPGRADFRHLGIRARPGRIPALLACEHATDSRWPDA